MKLTFLLASLFSTAYGVDPLVLSVLAFNISYFSVAMTKYQNHKDLEKEGFI